MGFSLFRSYAGDAVSASRFGEDGATLRIVCSEGVTGLVVVESYNAKCGTCVVDAAMRVSLESSKPQRAHHQKKRRAKARRLCC
jgi:hypothetical protein